MLQTDELDDRTPRTKPGRTPATTRVGSQPLHSTSRASIEIVSPASQGSDDGPAQRGLELAMSAPRRSPVTIKPTLLVRRSAAQHTPEKRGVKPGVVVGQLYTLRIGT